MKVLFCKRCGDIVAPYRENMKPRFCSCGTHAIWWTNSLFGIVQVYDIKGLNKDAEVIGIHNVFLEMPWYEVNKASLQEIIKDTSYRYLFKELESLIVRMHPGATSDTSWADKMPDAI